MGAAPGIATARLKLALWAAVGLLGLLALAGAVTATTNLLAYFQRGADPATALNIVPNVPPDLGVRLDWQAERGDVGRPLDPFARKEIGDAYLRAWLDWNLAYQRADGRGLATGFTGPALAMASDAVQDALAAGLSVTRADTAHRPRLTFFSADGNVAAFTDEGVLEARIIRDRAGVVDSGETRSTFAVVMILEDGRWRIRQLTRTAVEELGPGSTPAAQPEPGMPAVERGQLLVGGRPFAIAGVNYYPQATPWERFWKEYTPGVTDQDFARARGLGLNTVRIFVPYEQFGGQHVRPDMLAKLDDLLARADAGGLKVVVTLFDFRSDYSPMRWGQSDRHLETILTRYRASPAVLAWDIKNEPDLDYPAAGRAQVDLWLAHTLRQARAYAPGQLLTVGWSTPAAAATLAGDVDIITFHDYAPPEGLPARIAALRAASGGRPLLLGEYGLPTWSSPLFPNGHSEEDQQRYYAAALRAVRDSGAAGSIAWTLYDYSSVPATVAGRWPWQTGPQAQLGVLRADGRPKPAAALLAPGASLDVPPAAWWERFAKPFWLTLGGLATALLTAAQVWRQRRALDAYRPLAPLLDAAVLARRHAVRTIRSLDRQLAALRGRPPAAPPDPPCDGPPPSDG